MGPLDCPCTNCSYNSVLDNERRYWADLGLSLTLPEPKSPRVLAEREALLQHHHDIQRELSAAAAVGKDFDPSDGHRLPPIKYIRDWYICATPVAAPALALADSKGAAYGIDNDGVSATTITPKVVKELKAAIKRAAVTSTPSWHVGIRRGKRSMRGLQLIHF